MRNETSRTFVPALRPMISLILALCLLLSALPLTAMAASQAGSSPSSLHESSTKVYVKLSRSVVFFTGSKYGEGSLITPSVGAVCQLVSDDWYTASDGLSYYGVYYMNRRYNVLRSDVQGDIMSAAHLDDYIRNTLWKQGSYETLRKSMDLIGDVRVHAVQLALKELGYYTGKLDGKYGQGTHDAVKEFQRDKGLGADGSAGPLTQPVLFGALTGNIPSGGGTVVPDGTAPSAGTLRTNVSVNLRKRASTSSMRLASVPAGVNLAYTDTYTSGGVTWFNVRYNGKEGWLMGTYVTAKGSSASPAIGTVTITKGGTRVRDAANGNKTGTVLAKGSVVDLLASPISAGGYTWYNIRTGSGLVGYVRGDCATASIGGSTGGSTGGSSGGSSGSTTPSLPASDRTFIRLPATTQLFTSETKPKSGYRTVSSGTVLMMYSTDTYTKNGVEYCSFYYNNQKYNAVYAEVKSGIMSASQVSAYCTNLLSTTLNASLKRSLNLVGDVRVYALQSALQALGMYSGKLDGTYGNDTYNAVRTFQKSASLTVDGACGKDTWAALNARINGSTGGGSTGGGSTGGGSTGGTSAGDFGTVTRVVKASWDYGDNGADLIPKNSYATVMDVETGKVFRIYRWSGGYHADCVPASAADTQIMCEIVGFPYNSNHPSSSQLAKIKADGDKSTVTYTWPDFKNAFGGAKNIGSAWDRRPALLNVNGTVYPISIYGFPHGFNGTDSFSKAKFPNGQYFYAGNNYYGMMCLHFVGSKTHSGNLDSNHQKSVDKAYEYAKKLWPSLCN